MLGDVVAVEARIVRRRDEFQALVVLDRQGPVRALDMVEESDFHHAFHTWRATSTMRCSFLTWLS